MPILTLFDFLIINMNEGIDDIDMLNLQYNITLASPRYSSCSALIKQLDDKSDL